jgi:hypothetical protein
MFNLTKEEEKIFKRLNTPVKIQDYINTLGCNFEYKGDTCLSPRQVIREGHAHCLEAACLAAAILWYHKEEPLVLDLKASRGDFDHVVTVFKRNSCFGAISKTNHAVLRYREPIYKTIRELVMSYFHEYFIDNGRKTLRSYTMPVNLKRFGTEWITSEEGVWDIGAALYDAKHFPVLNKKMISSLRKADSIEIQAGKIVQDKK